MVGSNEVQTYPEIDGFGSSLNACPLVPCCREPWALTPAQTKLGPLVWRLDAIGRVEVGFWSIQDGVIVEVPAEDEAELRAIAEVYARC
jgi:hypothetical protein